MEMAIASGPVRTIAGRMKLHSGGTSTTLTSIARRSASLKIRMLTSVSLVAAITMNVRSRSSGRYSRRTHSIEPSDLEGKFMVIAATNDTEVNISVYDDAERRAMLVNVVDVPPLCNFILPAIVRTGPLAIAISTAGASPALAKRIKSEIAATYGEPYARLAVLLNDARGWAKATLPTYQDRKAFFEGIVNGSPDPIELLRAGDERAVVDLIEAAKRGFTPALS